MRRDNQFSPLYLLSELFAGEVLIPLYPFLKREDSDSRRNGRYKQKTPFEYSRTLLMIALIGILSVLYPAKPLTGPDLFKMAFWPSAWLKYGTTLPPVFFLVRCT